MVLRFLQFLVRAQFYLLIAGCGIVTCLPAKTPTIPFYPSELTGGLLPVADLQGEWIDEEDRRVAVPFQDVERREMLLHRNFDLPGFEGLSDTLYLYFEGLAWSAEVYLNDRLIAVTDDPFAEHLFQIKKEYFLPVQNRVEVRLNRNGLDYFLYPEHFVGVFRQALVLVAHPSAAFPALPEMVVDAKKALVLAPWTLENGFLYDTLAMTAMLDGLFSVPKGTTVYFPFRPSSFALSTAARLGARVATGATPDSLGFYNAYPVSNAMQPLLTPFWRQQDQRPASHYGHYIGLKQVTAPLVLPLDKVALLIFLLAPIIVMLLMKLLAPRIFSALPEYLTRSKIYLELIASNKFMKEEQRLLMNLARIFFLSITIALYLYYLRVTGGWDRLNVFSSRSLLYEIYAGTDYSLYVLFLQVFGVVAILTLLKYGLLNFIASIYRLHNLGSAAQSLDVFASFPVNLLPLIPGAVIFFLDARQGAIGLIIWYVLMLLYLLRRVVLVYGGIGRLFPLSVSLKILYVCTLEISPWIFLL